jgi:PAS domain S-box-containing protein
MTIETQKNFLGKTQTILMAEIESEKWSSWIRLGIAIGYSMLAFYSYSVDEITVNAFVVQMTAVLLLTGYSGFFLSRYSKSRLRTFSFFILVALDVMVMTTVLWSYALMGTPSVLLRSSLFSVYFIAIIFTALHNKMALSIFSGVMSSLCYSAYFVYFIHEKAGPIDTWVPDLAIRVCLLLIVATVAGIISRKNYDTINKVITSELRYQNLVHRLPEMLFTLDENGRFLWANNTSFALLGLPAKVIPNRSIFDFLAKADQLRLEKKEFKGTIQIRDFHGFNKFVDCTLQPSPEEGKPITFEGIMTDVSDRELALSQREEMVNRLYQYQKMESLGTLASGMAHDFNNILQTVGDITALVQKDTLEDETKKRMEIVTETLVEAKILISELLALGRKKLLDYTSIYLQTFFEGIIPLYGSQLGPQFEIVFKAPDEPLWIQGDGDYFKRIFQNLIGNSRDAMPKGGIITIECFADRSEGKIGTVVIRVSDTGSGISHEILDKIYDPFFTTKKQGKGTGLGLALVQRIVSLHNGRIVVEKTDKKGTTFRIEIPECDGGEINQDTTVIMLNRKSTMVLLLDDDPKIRSILRFFMKEFKYLVCEASTVDEGAKELARNIDECDVLIMDWKLGREDPHKAIKRLRAIKPGLIVIVVSGYAVEQKSVEEMKIWKWFTKPYDKNKLDLEIQKSLYFAKKSVQMRKLQRE